MWKKTDPMYQPPSCVIFGPSFAAAKEKSIFSNAWCPKPQQVNDKMLMDIFEARKPSKIHL
eukprot:1467012-Ditylum_brightwellii.AAC.1